MEIIPYTLAENAGLNPINIVTELRNRHINGDKHDGINVKKVNYIIITIKFRELSQTCLMKM